MAKMPRRPSSPVRLVLWGIGISGFCALGYEVLWTRVLTMVVGASVYSFTIILVAFLTGIALGSKAFGFSQRVPRGGRGARKACVIACSGPYRSSSASRPWS